jgi:hypothetical protein
VEGLFETLLCENLLSSESTADKLLIIDVTGPININLSDQCIDFLLIEVDTLDLAEASNEFFS